MRASSTIPPRCSFRIGALLAALALVVVPAILRATQYSIQHQTIRLSIRLNWNGDKVQAKADIPAPDTAPVCTPSLVVGQQDPKREACEACTLNTPLFNPPLDNSPDAPRGPPPSSLV